MEHREVFVLEFIEGPLDGDRIRFTRAELDSIHETPGGDEWKGKS